jgi:hypothetical protein
MLQFALPLHHINKYWYRDEVDEYKYKQNFHLTRPFLSLAVFLIERVALAHSALGI